jgi:hypothetical protein
MTKKTSPLIHCCVLALVVAVFSGCCTWRKHHKTEIIIVTDPQSQTVLQGSNVTFSVFALKGGPPWTSNGLTYQWQVNTTYLDGNLNWTNVAGATNTTLIVTNVQAANVGYYRVLVDDPVPSAAASLQMLSTSGGTITVYGTPRAKTAGSGTGCPGAYRHVIDFTNSPPNRGWGVTDRHASATAANAGSRTDVRITYMGVDAGDYNCGVGSVTVPATSTAPMPPTSTTPPATQSSRYEFTLYFRNSATPPSPYPMNLTNLE